MSRTYTIQITKNGINYSNTQSYATQGTTLFGITAGSMSLEKILCDGQFELGQCNSAKFEAQIFKLSEDITNATIKVYQTITTNNVPVTIQIFEGKIESSNKDRTNYFRDIVAYDMLYFVRDVDISAGWNGTSIWTDTVTSITLKTITQRLCNLVGISYQYPTSLVNDGIIFAPHFITLSSATFGTMLKMICELQGCFPVMNNGTLNFVTINTSATATNITNLYDAANTEFEDYNIDAIDCINVYSTSSDLVQSVYVNTHANAYAVAGNVFVLSMNTSDMQVILTRVLNLISPIVYNPAKIKMIIGDTSLVLGQKLKTTRNSVDYTHYIFKETFSDSLFVDQEIECQSAGKTRDSSVSQVNNQLISDQKMTEIRQDMDGIIIIAESKNKTYRQTSVPSVGISAGDLWYTTGTPTSPYISGKWYRYDGESWQLSEDSTIAEHTTTLETHSQEISAKVSQTGGASQTFAWSLTSSGFILTSNNNIVMSVNSSGITISGTASIGSNITINDIKNTADTASSTATSAYDLAEDAKDVADEAKDTADAASTTATSAQQAANSKSKTFAQASAPTSGMHEGDLWVNTNNSVNELYRYTNGAWVSIRDAFIQTAYNLAEGKTTTWYSDTEPVYATIGDIWYDTTAKKIKRLTATSPAKTWSDITNMALYDALAAADTAQTTADGKIVTYASASQPSTGSEGDLWIDTDDNNRLYRYTGSSWVDYRDGGISQAINDSSSAVQTANTAYASRVTNTQKVYYLKFVNAGGTYTAPDAPTEWVNDSRTIPSIWTTSIPTPAKYYHYYSCTQIKFSNGNFTNTQVIEEDARNIEIEWCSASDMVYIDGGKLYANSVTASQIATHTITANEINTASIQAAVVTAEVVNALDITAKNIEVINTSGNVLFSAITNKSSGGQTITNRVTIADFTITKRSSDVSTGSETFLSTGLGYLGDFGVVGTYIGSDGITYSNGISLGIQNPYITIQKNAGFIHAEKFEVGNTFLPVTNAYMDTMEEWHGQDVGSYRKVFRTVYCKQTSTGSSRNIKKDIVEIPEVYDTLFDNLIPRRYMYKGLNCDRQHIGFIVDEVGSAINSAGLTSLDYGAYQLYNIDDPNGMGGLNYLEFIALNTWQIQKLKARVAELERRLNNG